MKVEWWKRPHCAMKLRDCINHEGCAAYWSPYFFMKTLFNRWAGHYGGSTEREPDKSRKKKRWFYWQVCRELIKFFDALLISIKWRVRGQIHHARERGTVKAAVLSRAVARHERLFVNVKLLKQNLGCQTEVGLFVSTNYWRPIQTFSIFWAKSWPSDPEFVLSTILSATPVNILTSYTHRLWETCVLNI